MSGVAGAALPTVHSGPPANSLKTLDQVTSVLPGDTCRLDMGTVAHRRAWPLQGAWGADRGQGPAHPSAVGRVARAPPSRPLHAPRRQPCASFAPP